MDRWVGKSAIVTGVSSGIGEIIVEKLVYAGVNVLGLARREDRLQALAQRFKGAKGKFHYLKCDLRNEQDILKAFACAEKTFGCLDILVNNAGVFFIAPFDAAKTEDYRSLMDINVLAPAICIREALKLMRKHKNDGHIININSVAGHNAVISEVPMNLYPASKFALRAMTETLKREIKLKQDKIRVTGIHPGLVKTEILNAFGDKTNELLDKMPYMESKDVADCVIFALSMPQNVQVSKINIERLNHLYVKKRWLGKLAVVTGASSGIGEAISKVLVANGLNVLGLARREDKLKELTELNNSSTGKFHFMKCDLYNESDILKAFNFAESNFGGGLYPGLVKTEIISLGGFNPDMYKILPYLEPKDLADCLVFALSAPPHVQVDDLVINPVKR
ncbi:GSCOCG00013258001-RA-CDS [Cotesia congregata]|nr:GSCOCG00013258001-RA-CDS [Cotesia congregata]